MKTWLRKTFPGAALQLKAMTGRLYGDDVERLTLQHCDRRVIAGPFKGMRYIDRSNCSALAPKLLGTYELEVVPFIEDIIRNAPGHVIDIGCAEGYYAVGMALRLPGAQIHAFDIDTSALGNLRSLAALNDVTDRLLIAGECSFETLNSFGGRPVAVICDIEGAERHLLDPAKASALAGFDMLVEIHDGQHSNAIRDTLIERFSHSHKQRFVAYRERTAADAAAAHWLGHPRNRLIAVDEQRTFGIEWGYFESIASRANTATLTPSQT